MLCISRTLPAGAFWVLSLLAVWGRPALLWVWEELMWVQTRQSSSVFGDGSYSLSAWLPLIRASWQHMHHRWCSRAPVCREQPKHICIWLTFKNWGQGVHKTNTGEEILNSTSLYIHDNRRLRDLAWMEEEEIWLLAKEDRSVLLPRGAFEPLNTAVDWSPFTTPTPIAKHMGLSAISIIHQPLWPVWWILHCSYSICCLVFKHLPSVFSLMMDGQHNAERAARADWWKMGKAVMSSKSQL